MPWESESLEMGLANAAATVNHLPQSGAEEHSRLPVKCSPGPFFQEVFSDLQAGQVPLLYSHSPGLSPEYSYCLGLNSGSAIYLLCVLGSLLKIFESLS